jgi:uncharacterized protein with NRDE domain
MCIVLLTTAHPDYSLIVLDNRDEFILRPTSRPYWWRLGKQEILSSRDLQRPEQGTWLGVTKTGKFAVLTNYRESNSHDASHPIEGQRSRGAMVTAWLGSDDDESTSEFVERLFHGDGVKGVGGFSLLCGTLKKADTKGGIEPLAIVSNRYETVAAVPWVAKDRDEVYGLSNTFYSDPVAWPKVETGKERVAQVIEDIVQSGAGEEELVEKLWEVLDIDTLPPRNGESFEEYIFQLRNSIFIPAIIDDKPELKAEDLAAAGEGQPVDGHTSKVEVDTGPKSVYGTQRQTIILVDWQGNVSYRERSLWDEHGNAVPRGEGDVKFEFGIEGWQGADV